MKVMSGAETVSASAMNVASSAVTLWRSSHTAERMEQLGVHEVRRVEVAVLGEALDQARRGIERGDCLKDCRGVSDRDDREGCRRFIERLGGPGGLL
jgi:hypothetical protein